MIIQDNLSILIINSNIASRGRLREVLKSFLYKVRISYAQNLKEAKKMLLEGTEIDVGFVEFDIGQTEIREFIGSLQTESSKPVPPFICTLRSRGEGSTADITSMYLEGIAGFISEPYSSNDILKLLSTLTEKKSQVEQKDKLKRASGLLLIEAVRQIDLLAETQSKKNEGMFNQTLKSLKLVSRSLQTLYEQDKEQYATALIDAFENIEPPKTEQSAKQKRVVIKEVLHPGKIISDLMVSRKLTLESLEHTIKIDQKEFKELLAGERPIDEISSREVSRIFGRTSKEWLKMQADYDAYIASKNKSSGQTQS